MNPTWTGRPDPHIPSLTAREWLRAAPRLLAIAGIVGVAAAVFLPVRAWERLGRKGRPWTPAVASAAFAAILRALGIRRVSEGIAGGSALVANHSSWLDIAALYAGGPLIFVSKAEVADWPLIGAMTRLCGTIYIDRRRTDAAGQAARLSDAVASGHRLAFFPEGTSSDGQRVLPFRTALFAAFVGRGENGPTVQPVGLVYTPPPGLPPEFHAWWGGTPFGPHAMRVLGAPAGGVVTVRYGWPIPAGQDRKALARRLEGEVRALAGTPVSPSSRPEAS